MAIFCFWKMYKVFSLSLSRLPYCWYEWLTIDDWLFLLVTLALNTCSAKYRKEKIWKRRYMQNEKIPRMKAELKENSPKKAHTLLTCFIIRETTCIKRRRLEMLYEWTNRARSMPYCMLGVLLYTCFFLIARTPTHGIVPLSTHFYCTLSLCVLYSCRIELNTN